jgi:hypothetical protein
MGANIGNGAAFASGGEFASTGNFFNAVYQVIVGPVMWIMYLIGVLVALFALSSGRIGLFFTCLGGIVFFGVAKQWIGIFAGGGEFHQIGALGGASVGSDIIYKSRTLMGPWLFPVFGMEDGGALAGAGYTSVHAMYSKIATLAIYGCIFYQRVMDYCLFIPIIPALMIISAGKAYIEYAKSEKPGVLLRWFVFSMGAYILLVIPSVQFVTKDNPAYRAANASTVTAQPTNMEKLTFHWALVCCWRERIILLPWLSRRSHFIRTNAQRPLLLLQRTQLLTIQRFLLWQMGS